MGRGGFGAPMMGNHMGGMGGGMRGGRNFTNDLYADYNGPDGSVVANGMGGPAIPAANVEPSVQIIVRNVSTGDVSLSAYLFVVAAALVNYQRGSCRAV
jgi:hypothetical protein